MKHLLLGKFTRFFDVFSEHASVIISLAQNVGFNLSHRDMARFTTQLRLFDFSPFVWKILTCII